MKVVRLLESSMRSDRKAVLWRENESAPSMCVADDQRCINPVCILELENPDSVSKRDLLIL